ncbi:GumC family protein [Pararobbsia silviterrae]|uniref:GumC family protein n=1 Tax=Pararobbsia silviterrae TaxID=1792498 RepID=UPI0023E81F50|nr:Wzz/FepE/Etk N-terminal domain-containing protein [Pararobbsia silviterrae]
MGLLSVNLNQLGAILFARRRVITGVALATLAATALILAIVPRAWTASSDVYVDFKANNPLDSSAYSSLSPNSDDDYIHTQIDMIQSPAVIERMLKIQGLLPAGGDGTDTKARSDIMQSVARKLVVGGGHGTRILQVSFSDKSPTRARDGANAIVDAYLALSQEVSAAAARSVSDQYTARLEQLRHEVNTVQAELTNYREQNGITDAQSDNNMEESRRLQDMLTEQQTLQAQTRDAHAREQMTDAMLKSGVRPEDLPQMATVATLNDLHENLNQLNREIGAVDGALGRNHPTVQGLYAERQRLQSRMATTAQANLVAQRDDLKRLDAQQASLDDAIAQQRKRVLQQMAQHDRLAAYQRQLDSAEQVYNDAVQKYGSVLMASSISLPHAVVLHRADVPVKPSSPRVTRGLLAGLLVGLLGGIALALLLEFRNRHVRCADDLLHNPALGMIGRIGSPLGASALARA